MISRMMIHFMSKCQLWSAPSRKNSSATSMTSRMPSIQMVRLCETMNCMAKLTLPATAFL